MSAGYYDGPSSYEFSKLVDAVASLSSQVSALNEQAEKAQENLACIYNLLRLITILQLRESFNEESQEFINKKILELINCEFTKGNDGKYELLRF